MALVTCPNCGKEISDKTQFCIHCKTDLRKKYCPECGKEAAFDEKVCKSCGYQLAKITVMDKIKQSPKLRKKYTTILIVSLIAIASILLLKNFVIFNADEKVVYEYFMSDPDGKENLKMMKSLSLIKHYNFDGQVDYREIFWDTGEYRGSLFGDELSTVYDPLELKRERTKIFSEWSLSFQEPHPSWKFTKINLFKLKLRAGAF